MPVAEVLHDRCQSDVFLFRLPGHEDLPDSMDQCRYLDWIDAADTAYRQVAKSYKRVILYGVSMGAVLSAGLAAKYPVDGFINMAAPWIPSSLRLRMGPYFGQGIPLLMEKLGRKYWQDKSDPPNRYPYAALIELMRLILSRRRKVSYIHCPTLILHSVDDTVAAPRSAKWLQRHIGSQQQHCIWTEGEHHFLLEPGKYKDEMEQIVTFVNDPLAYFDALGTRA